MRNLRFWKPWMSFGKLLPNRISKSNGIFTKKYADFRQRGKLGKYLREKARG